MLHYGNVPRVNLKEWNFRIFGEVEKEWRCNWEEFRALPWLDVQCDIHHFNDSIFRAKRAKHRAHGKSPRGVAGRALS